MSVATVEQALLADIIAHPGDDGLRLIYADWLEDNARAERVPCPSCSPYAGTPCLACDGFAVSYTLARSGERKEASRCGLCGGSGETPPGWHPEADPASGRHEGGWTNCKACNDAGGTPGSVARSDGGAERAGFIRHGVLHPDSPGNDMFARAAWRDSATAILRLAPDDRRGWDWVWRRGFIAECSCTLAEWMGHGPSLAARHPIERVTLTDAAPADGGDGGGREWYWFDGSRNGTGFSQAHHLPAQVFGLLRGGERGGPVMYYGGRDAALGALSDALLALARGRNFRKTCHAFS